ncbi:MAG: alpha-amylase family protein, partial [Chloroflexota bacterium]
PKARQGHFPVGVYEDAALLEGDVERFMAMVEDLRSRGFDSVLLTNGHIDRDEEVLAAADRLAFDVYYGPHYELAREWWPAEVPADREKAREVIAPLVERLGTHPSLRGYYIVDEPTLDLKDKVALATEVFRELDPSRPVMPNLVGLDRVGPIYSAARPDVMLVNVFPFGANAPVGDFTLSGFGYDLLGIDSVGYLRLVTQPKPADVPLWLIAQAHRFMEPGERFALREPLPAEMRAQQWLAVGEGATGLFWFVYSSQQGWRGLKDNPDLYDEASRLVRRLLPLRETLLELRRSEDGFRVAGAGNPYVSTLVGKTDSRPYAVLVNRDCERSRELSVTSSSKGQLRDLETGQVFAQGEPITLGPGDGMVLVLLDERS